MQLQTLVPANKFDLAAVDRAKAAGYPAIAPVLGELLEWMQDMNWPVANAVEKLLVPIGAPLSPHVLNILKGDDDIWKYWVLNRIAVHFDHDARALILDECIRLTNSPSKGETTEEVNLAAQNILILDSHDQKIEQGTDGDTEETI